jgi:hypothetical protein
MFSRGACLRLIIAIRAGADAGGFSLSMRDDKDMLLRMTLTLRDIPIDLDAALRKRAELEHRSVDQVAVEAMKAGLGFGKLVPTANANTNLAAAIRARFSPLGGVELAEPIRELMPDPLDLG